MAAAGESASGLGDDCSNIPDITMTIQIIKIDVGNLLPAKQTCCFGGQRGHNRRQGRGMGHWETRDQRDGMRGKGEGTGCEKRGRGGGRTEERKREESLEMLHEN